METETLKNVLFCSNQHTDWCKGPNFMGPTCSDW